MHRPQTPPPPHPEWDAPPPPPDELPQYTHKDPELERRESISRALWDEHRAHEAALARAQLADRIERLERQRTHDSTNSQGGGMFHSWIRWSAKFYMPLMSRWGEQRAH
jgi:hypothetical protein